MDSLKRTTAVSTEPPAAHPYAINHSNRLNWGVPLCGMRAAVPSQTHTAIRHFLSASTSKHPCHLPKSRFNTPHAHPARAKPMSELLKRGPIPTWRVILWTCVAAVGVFWFGSDHSWRMALFASLFCGIFCGGFFFALNWIAGNRGQAWSRTHIRQILTAYSIALAASALLKLLDIFLHKS